MNTFQGFYTVWKNVEHDSCFFFLYWVKMEKVEYGKICVFQDFIPIPPV